MRIRKYRVWNLITKKWVDSIAIIANTGELCDVGECFWNIIGTINEKDYIVQDYIGLQDKTGRDIYEGDILKVDADNENPGVIKWSKNSCYILSKRLLNSKETTSKQVNKGSTKFWTVIGNIFENPEFLE